MLTRKQLELLLFINERLKEEGVPPSFEEMKEALNLQSKSGVHRLIVALGRCLLVVEGRRHGGTSNSVDWATRVPRTIFAVPGRIGDPLAEGVQVRLRPVPLVNGRGTVFSMRARHHSPSFRGRAGMTLRKGRISPPYDRRCGPNPPDAYLIGIRPRGLYTDSPSLGEGVDPAHADGEAIRPPGSPTGVSPFHDAPSIFPAAPGWPRRAVPPRRPQRWREEGSPG